MAGIRPRIGLSSRGAASCGGQHLVSGLVETRFARSHDIDIASQMIGEAPCDIVMTMEEWRINGGCTQKRGSGRSS